MQWWNQRRQGVRVSSAVVQSAPLACRCRRVRTSRNARTRALTSRVGCGGPLYFLPESPRADAERHDGEQKDTPEKSDHEIVWHDRVEVAPADGPGEAPAVHDESGREHECDEAGGQAKAGQQIVAPERGREEPRPAVILVRADANLRQRPRYVDAEFVGRGVLTRVETFTAVVAQVREEREVHRREGQTPFHRRKHGTVLLAVPARVTDRHHVLTVPDQFIGWHAAPPPRRRAGRRPCRWSCRLRRCIPCAGYCPPSPRRPRRCFSRSLRRASVPARAHRP